MPSVPSLRIRAVNSAAPAEGDYVVYWMIAQRRLRSNFALDRAIEWCQRLGKPLVVFEPLRLRYRWASDRHHAFVVEGMRDHAAMAAGAGVTYVPWVERSVDDGKGLLEALAKRAAVVVTDDWPCFFLPKMVATAGTRLRVPLEAIDGAGMLPVRAADRAFGRAFDLRRFLQKNLPDHLGDRPRQDPLRTAAKFGRATLEPALARRLARGAVDFAAPLSELFAELPIDHAVPPSPVLTGGASAAHAQLRHFLADGLPRYGEERSHPDADAQSNLSPWLHFGHLGVHEVFEAVTAAEGWSVDRLSEKVTGSNQGWWGTSATAESFLDELITWRELGLNFCHFQPDDYDRYESLPGWARASLEAHGADPRPHLYSPVELANGETDDEIWNAAANQLRTEGRLHNYLRMLWGKRVLEWTPGPREALQVLVDLNNRYALDGRDPNSYSGIFWCLGRYDRPWAPQREIFGMIRYMSSANTRRKLRLSGYLARYRNPAGRGLLPGFA
jgi:deoxyribodipyrimidine photo-lyase